MVEFGFGDVLSLAQTFGIVGTLILTLYFSKRQIQSLSIDQQTRVLNDLDASDEGEASRMLGSYGAPKSVRDQGSVASRK